MKSLVLCCLIFINLVTAYTFVAKPSTTRHSIHHIEFVSVDHSSAASHLSKILNIPNSPTLFHSQHQSLVSHNDLRLLVTSSSLSAATKQFLKDSGNLSVFAVCIQVDDAEQSYKAAVEAGAKGVLEPCLSDSDSDSITSNCVVAETILYGDVRLRFLSGAGADRTSPTPNSILNSNSKSNSNSKLNRVDHCVGNVPSKFYDSTISAIKRQLNYSEFAEFLTSEVGTEESGLNSVVLSSESGKVLLPINEPVNGSRKSQIQTYLDLNEGRGGVQHLAIESGDIFETVRMMREVEGMGGANNEFNFEMMERPVEEYFDGLGERLGGRLSCEQVEQCRELGVLADYDKEGVLLQIFTKPVGERATFFFEIIQRVGCSTPGCGGFGKGNFKALFKSIEAYERKQGLA